MNALTSIQRLLNIICVRDPCVLGISSNGWSVFHFWVSPSCRNILCVHTRVARSRRLLKNETLNNRKSLGFTLIELLLATSIGSVVIACVYLTFNTAIDSQRRIDRVSVQTQQKRYLFERLRNDIKNLVLPSNSFSGSSTGIKLAILDENATVHEVDYFLRNSRSGMQLVRRVIKLNQFDSDSISVNEGKVESIVFEGLDAFTLRYWVNGSWQNTTTHQTFPRAVEFSLISNGIKRVFVLGLEIDNA